MQWNVLFWDRKGENCVMKFEVKTNKEFRPYVILTIVIFSLGIYPLGIVGLIGGIHEREIIFIGMAVGLFWLGSILYARELHKGLDKYEFEEKCFTVKLFYGKRKKITPEDITLCGFRPSCPIYDKMSSDAIFFYTDKKQKKPMIIYKDYHENFNKVRRWILDNEVKVIAGDNPLGEKHPRYVNFINKEIDE